MCKMWLYFLKIGGDPALSMQKFGYRILKTSILDQQTMIGNLSLRYWLCICDMMHIPSVYNCNSSKSLMRCEAHKLKPCFICKVFQMIIYLVCHEISLGERSWDLSCWLYWNSKTVGDLFWQLVETVIIKFNSAHKIRVRWTMASS